MTVMGNMFLIIIEDSYMEVKDRGKYDWLLNRKERDMYDEDGKKIMAEEEKSDELASKDDLRSETTQGLKKKLTIQDVIGGKQKKWVKMMSQKEQELSKDMDPIAEQNLEESMAIKPVHITDASYLVMEEMNEKSILNNQSMSFKVRASNIKNQLGQLGQDFANVGDAPLDANEKQNVAKKCADLIK